MGFVFVADFKDFLRDKVPTFSFFPQYASASRNGCPVVFCSHKIWAESHLTNARFLSLPNVQIKKNKPFVRGFQSILFF